MSDYLLQSRLGAPEMASIILGQSPPSETYNETGRGLPFFQGKADFGFIYPNTRIWCDSGQQFAEADDILISVRAPVGDVNIAKERCAIGRGLSAIRAGKLIDPWFLFFALQFSKPILESRATGSTFASINKAILLDLTIPAPPIPEQRAIATELQRLEKSIDNESTIISQSIVLKRAAMRELFTRGLRGEAQKETGFGLVPESWTEQELKSVAIVQTGVAKGRKFVGEEMIEVPYLRVANVQDGRLDLSEIKTIQIRKHEIDRYRLQDDDVLLTEGGDFDKLGRGFIWKGQIKDCVHQNHVFAVRTKKAEILPAFFAYLVQSDYGKAYFLQVAHKTTNLACINTQKLMAFPCILPSFDEQREIVEILDAIDAKIDLHKRKKALLEELFKSLLHKLMTGEIRVEELDLGALTS
jgi:type I restriction enzyme, S subunit